MNDSARRLGGNRGPDGSLRRVYGFGHLLADCPETKGDQLQS